MKRNKVQGSILFLPLLAWACYLAWWLVINYTNGGNIESVARDNFTDTYSVVALVGGIVGLIAAKKWGLFKSKFGSALGYFSVGLLMHFLGFGIYTLYYRIGGVALAFPNIGDVPLLLTSLFYIFAVYNLLKVIVFKGSIFKPRAIFVVSLLATFGLLWLLWGAFLHLGINDERGNLYSLLNVAYPLIQAVYFVLGIVAVMQAKRMTGGKMLIPVIVMLMALVLQYAADFTFLYQSYHETWVPAGSNDLLYLLGFGIMSLSILMIDRVRRNVLTPVTQDSMAEVSNER
jgi:hypothetical protein